MAGSLSGDQHHCEADAFRVFVSVSGSRSTGTPDGDSRASKARLFRQGGYGLFRQRLGPPASATFPSAPMVGFFQHRDGLSPARPGSFAGQRD